MDKTPEHAVARSTTADHLNVTAPSQAGLVSRQLGTLVFDPGPGHTDLVAILLQRAAHARGRLELASEPTDAERLATAFRGGADAYVVGCGDLRADLAFVDGAASAGAPYTAVH